MAGIPTDYSIIGTVLAIAVAIIVISGLALYIAFRVKETLRDEKGRGARAAKVGLLIGLLFLTGGVFYFFAAGFSAQQGTSSTGTTSASVSTTSSSSIQTSIFIPPGSSTTTSSNVSSTSISSIPFTSSATSPSSQGISMVVQCPSSGTSVRVGQTFNCTFTIYNVGSSTFQSATLTSSGGFSQFSFQSCSETSNGNPASCSVASSSEISVGTINPGTTVLNVAVVAPGTSGQKNCVITLAAPGMSSPYSVSFTIQVTH